VNVPPIVVLKAPRQMFKNQKSLFTVEASDTDQRPETLGFSWFQQEVAREKPCPGTAADAQRQVTSVVPLGRSANQDVTLPGFGTFCVWVIVTDQDGASGFAGERFEVSNQPPTARLELLAPKPLRVVDPIRYVPLYSNVRVSAAGSEDPEREPLEYRWKITGRGGDGIAASPCDGANLSQLCHRLDGPGDYRFELRVWDGTMESAPETLPLLVMPDAPPCIQQTEPPFGLPRVVAFSTERLNVSVTEVNDDGDPFPAPPGQLTQTTFVWRYRYVGSTEFERRVSNMPSVSFAPETFRPGEELEVRLDVIDRVPDRDFSACGEGLQCQIESGSGCWQRVSWRVSFR
jgi:hypothetical protein